MPTAYFAITNRYVMKLVDEKNFDLLDEYLNDNFDVLENYGKLDLNPISSFGCCVGPWIGLSDQYDEKLHYVLSYAIVTKNTEVVEHYRDDIYMDKRLDGNMYTLSEIEKCVNKDDK